MVSPERAQSTEYNLPFEEEKPRHECGIVGIYSPGNNAARELYYSLITLLNRGQESSGIATYDGNKIHLHKGKGIPYSVFDEESLDEIPGFLGIGHNRYGTTGIQPEINAQPMVEDTFDGKIALAHNGNIVNAAELKAELVDLGEKFQSTSDTEIIVKLFARANGDSWQERIRNATDKLHGAYSIVMLADGKLFGVRDPLGFWPLCLGKLNDEGYILASESAVLDYSGAEFVREIEHGEIITIGEGVPKSEFLPREKSSFCIFEFYYFANPDSSFFGRRIYSARKEMGRKLWEEYPVDADVVVPIPETAIPAAIGFSEASGIPTDRVLGKNRYALRTFIAPTQRMRDADARRKYNPYKELIEGKKVVLIDDSIVRGTTTPKVIELLQKAGAKEVHMRITAPPIKHPCFFGIDMATKRELIASEKSVAEIGKHIGADSLGYLSLESGLKAINSALRKDLCTACFTGEYSIEAPQGYDRAVFEPPAIRLSVR